MLKKMKKMDSKKKSNQKAKKEKEKEVSKQDAVILDSQIQPQPVNQTVCDLKLGKQLSLEINIPQNPRPMTTRQENKILTKTSKETPKNKTDQQSSERKNQSSPSPMTEMGLKLQYNKVMQTIYWYDGTEKQKIEIRSDFFGNKRVQMKPIEPSSKATCPEKATHYIKKLLDTKIYEFVFFVDDKEQTSPHYKLNEQKKSNVIDLSDAEVKIFIKKPKKQVLSNQNVKSSQGSHSHQKLNTSQYDSFSQFIENEEDTLVQIEDDPSFDDDFEELNKQEDMSLNQLIQNVEINNVEIIQSLQLPTQIKNVPNFAFKSARNPQQESNNSNQRINTFNLHLNIEKVINESSGREQEKNSKPVSYRQILAGNGTLRSDGRKSLIMKKQKSSTAITAPEVQSDLYSTDLKKKQESTITPQGLGQSQLQSKHFDQEELILAKDDSSGQEDIDIEEAASSLFQSWFDSTFQKYSQQIGEKGQVFITKEQFDTAVRSIDVVEEEDQIQHLLSLYTFADQRDEGKITQQQLMDAIRRDLKIQLGQEDSYEQSKDPFKSPGARMKGDNRAPGTTTIQKSQTNGRRPSTTKNRKNSNNNMLDFVDGMSEDLERNEENKLQIEEIKMKNELKVNNFAYPDDDTDKDREISNDASMKSQLIRIDPIINQLHLFNSKELQGIVRCDNLIEVLEYIASNKLDEYRNDETALQEVFKLLIENSKLMSREFENLQAKVETLDDMGNEEVQQYQEQNSELEGQLCLMEAELEKMKMYEQSYHTQEKRLQAALDNAEDLFEEKNNIEQVHLDLVSEFNEARKENETLQFENRSLSLEVQGLTAQTNQLKKQVIDGFADGTDSESEVTKVVDDCSDSDTEEQKNAGDSQRKEKAGSPGKESKSSRDPQILSPKEEGKRLQQDIPTDLDPLLPLGTQKELQPTAQQQALERMLEEEENAILSDLETTDVFRLQGRIKNYIENNVRPNRLAMRAQITKQHQSQVQREQVLRKKCTTAQIKGGELYNDLERARLTSVQYQNSREAKQREVEALQEQLQTVIQQNQQLRDEKVRIASVNSILEQKIQVERSGLLSLKNDMDTVVRHGGLESMQSASNSKVLRNMGQMSSYLRKQQSAIRSVRGSAYSGVSGAQSLQRRQLGPRLGGQKMSAYGNSNYGGASHRDRESQNQRMFIKYQTKKNAGNQSAYRDDAASSTGGFELELSSKDVVLDDDQSDSSSVVVRLPTTPKTIPVKNSRVSSGSSFRGSTSGSVKSGRRGKGGGERDRVQVIDDIDSEESIGEWSQNELGEINQDIQEQERTALVEKRAANQYDLLGLQKETHEFYDQIRQIRENWHEEKMKRQGLGKREHKGMILKLVEFKDAAENALYSEAIKVYFNRKITEALLVLFEGLLFLFQLDDTKSKVKLMFRPFNFLDDVQKVIYSEKYEKYLALKLADLRKTEGNRDHLIVELTDRELFADFVMEYAEKEEDEVIFEQNEEFSMIADSSPVWFSFEDVERCNKTRDSKNQFKNQDLTGFLEHKSSLGINIGAIFKMMVSQKANWVQKYFALQGLKLFIYKDQKFDKPSQVLELTEDLVLKEVRKGDCQGKKHVFTLQPSKDKPAEWFSASSESTLSKWLEAFRAIKNQFQVARQQERDKLKLAMKKPVVDKSNRICSGVFERKAAGSDERIEEEDSEGAEGDDVFDFSGMMDQELGDAKQKISFYNDAITHEPEPVVVEELEAIPVSQNARRKAFQPKNSIIPEADEEEESAIKFDNEEQKEQIKSPRSSGSDYSFKSIS